MKYEYVSMLMPHGFEVVLWEVGHPDGSQKIGKLFFRLREDYERWKKAEGDGEVSLVETWKGDA